MRNIIDPKIYEAILDRMRVDPLVSMQIRAWDNYGGNLVDYLAQIVLQQSVQIEHLKALEVKRASMSVHGPMFITKQVK